MCCKHCLCVYVCVCYALCLCMYSWTYPKTKTQKIPDIFDYFCLPYCFETVRNSSVLTRLPGLWASRIHKACDTGMQSYAWLFYMGADWTTNSVLILAHQMFLSIETYMCGEAQAWYWLSLLIALHFIYQGQGTTSPELINSDQTRMPPSNSPPGVYDSPPESLISCPRLCAHRRNLRSKLFNSMYQTS